jgi:hypothetical protein
MPTIQFPTKDKIKPTYWTIHIDFFIQIFIAGGFNVEFNESLRVIENTFEVEFDGRKILFDFGDSASTKDQPEYFTVFKSHYEPQNAPKNMEPWSPISFYKWDEQAELSSRITYNPDSNKILNNQKSYGNAIERRNKVRTMLVTHYGPDVDTTITDQIVWWRKLGNSMGYVHVSGFSNNMIDRASNQTLAFGSLLITTRCPETLPYYKMLIPNEHYIEIKDDFSDLYEKIEWCKENRSKCKEIGDNAKYFFASYLTPIPLVNWFKNNV